VEDVQVRAADPGRLDLDEDVAVADLRHRDLAELDEALAFRRLDESRHRSFI
jgi:hypothetical protein